MARRRDVSTRRKGSMEKPGSSAQEFSGGRPHSTALNPADRFLGGRNEKTDTIRDALQQAGIEFIDENGGGPGV
jgi:hypothetical protein